MGGGAGFARTRVGGAIARVVDAPPAGTGPGEIAVAIRGIDPGLEPRLRAAVEAEGGRVAPDAGTGPGRALVIAPAPAWPRLTASSARVGGGTQEVFDEIARALGAEGDRSPRTVPGAHRPLRVGERTLVMGVVNVTPDSFSDGGAFLETGAAVARALDLEAEGADLIDVGGESTRPGAAPVTPAAEWRRVGPVLDRLRGTLGVPLSIDTRHAEVARRAVDAGADVVNDVRGLADAAMRRVVAGSGAAAVVMHLRGTPATMAERAVYDDVRGEVAEELGRAVARAVADGVPAERLLVDPGLGFAKTAAQSLELLAHAGELRSLGYPVVVGASRKSFLGAILGGAPVGARLEASVAAAVLAAAQGVEVVRVHDVAPTVRALAVVAAVRGARARAAPERPGPGRAGVRAGSARRSRSRASPRSRRRGSGRPGR